MSNLGVVCIQNVVLRGRDPEVRVRFPALPDFLKSSGSATGSTQSREYTRGVDGVICVAEKWCVSSEIRTEFLNIIRREMTASVV
jgi:hypothetical protein